MPCESLAMHLIFIIMERLVLLPFSGGCDSQYGVAVLDQRRARRSPPFRKGIQGNEDMGSQALLGESRKISAPGRSTAIVPKPHFSHGFQRLLKHIRSMSQLFGCKDDADMHIGLPTNVKHVTHIGWGGGAEASDPMNGWEALLQPPKICNALYTLTS
uniref:CRIB domain-containing protein n=1 Tax=Kalanchoe fedtschenkoi TaxID=63787 RepID=A0A7N0T885_KALFE